MKKVKSVKVTHIGEDYGYVTITYEANEKQPETWTEHEVPLGLALALKEVL